MCLYTYRLIIYIMRIIFLVQKIYLYEILIFQHLLSPHEISIFSHHNFTTIHKNGIAINFTLSLFRFSYSLLIFALYSRSIFTSHTLCSPCGCTFCVGRKILLYCANTKFHGVLELPSPGFSAFTPRRVELRETRGRTP